MLRICIACDFKIKNNDELTQHLNKCLMTQKRKCKKESRSEMKQKEKSKKKALYHLCDDLFIFKQIKVNVDVLNTSNDMIYDEAVHFLKLNYNQQNDINVHNIKIIICFSLI